MATKAETIFQLDFALTEAIKSAGLRAGYAARETIAPGKRTFADCTVDEKKKILELLHAQACGK